MRNNALLYETELHLRDDLKRIEMNQNTILNICIKTATNFRILYKIWVPHPTTSWKATNWSGKTLYEGESNENLKHVLFHNLPEHKRCTMTSFFYVVFIATCQPIFKPRVSLLKLTRQSSCGLNFYHTFKVFSWISLIQESFSISSSFLFLMLQMLNFLPLLCIAIISSEFISLSQDNTSKQFCHQVG